MLREIVSIVAGVAASSFSAFANEFDDDRRNYWEPVMAPNSSDVVPSSSGGVVPSSSGAASSQEASSGSADPFEVYRLVAEVVGCVLGLISLIVGAYIVRRRRQEAPGVQIALPPLPGLGGGGGERPPIAEQVMRLLAVVLRLRNLRR